MRKLAYIDELPVRQRPALRDDASMSTVVPVSIKTPWETASG